MEAQNGFPVHLWTENREKSTKSSYSTIKLAFCGAQKMTKKGIIERFSKILKNNLTQLKTGRTKWSPRSFLDNKSTTSSYSTVKLAFCGAQKMTEKRKIDI